MSANSEIAFIDIEVGKNNHKINDIGLACDKLQWQIRSVGELKDIFEESGATFICGHNFINHDKKYLLDSGFQIASNTIIDTLALSLLLYPYIATHKLEKRSLRATHFLCGHYARKKRALYPHER